MKRIQRYTTRRNHPRLPTHATNIRVGVAATASAPHVLSTTSPASATASRAVVVESLFAANPSSSSSLSTTIASRRASTTLTASTPAIHRLPPPQVLLPAVVALRHSPFASRIHLDMLHADEHLWNLLRLHSMQGSRQERGTDALARQIFYQLQRAASNAQSARSRRSDAMAGLLPSVMERGREVVRQTNDFMTAVVATFLCLFLF